MSADFRDGKVTVNLIPGCYCEDCEHWEATMEGLQARCRNDLAPTLGEHTLPGYGCVMGRRKAQP